VKDADPVPIALAFIAAINAHDVDALVTLMTPDHLFVDAGGQTVRGSTAMRDGWTSYFQGFPDYHIGVRELLTFREVVGVFGTASGTYAPDGNMSAENSWEIPAAWEARVRNGRVCEWRVYADNAPVSEIMAKTEFTRGA
jgi:ketosteroid isomerase-like protein